MYKYCVGIGISLLFLVIIANYLGAYYLGVRFYGASEEIGLENVLARMAQYKPAFVKSSYFYCSMLLMNLFVVLVMGAYLFRALLSERSGKTYTGL